MIKKMINRLQLLRKAANEFQRLYESLEAHFCFVQSASYAINE